MKITLRVLIGLLVAGAILFSYWAMQPSTPTYVPFKVPQGVTPTIINDAESPEELTE